LANDELVNAIQVASKQNLNAAKNVIMLLGDGMGVQTVSAARVYKSQSRKQSQQDMYLSWETFPHIALSRVSLNLHFVVE